MARHANDQQEFPNTSALFSSAASAFDGGHGGGGGDDDAGFVRGMRRRHFAGGARSSEGPSPSFVPPPFRSDFTTVTAATNISRPPRSALRSSRGNSPLATHGSEPEAPDLLPQETCGGSVDDDERFLHLLVNSKI